MEASAPPVHPNVAVVQRYLAALASGDTAAATALFADDLTYVAPGRNRLAGVYRGADGAGRWFTGMQELAHGTYGITETVDWLASDTHAFLLAREHAEIDGAAHDWTRLIVFTIEDGKMAEVQLFEDDQRAYDAWLGGQPGLPAAPSDDAPVPPGPPAMTGDLEDARVQAIGRYQQQVAQGDLDAARTIFAPDVRYVVPGTSPMSGTYSGPDAVMGYFARLGELTGGTYAITRMHWATSAERVALLTRNVAERGGRRLAWDECIVFRFEDGVKKSISHFSGDQYGVDALFS